MTALHPTVNATGSTPILALGDAPTLRIRARSAGGTAPAWAQLGAAIAAAGLIWVAVIIAIAGYPFAAVPLAVLAAAIFVGAVIPDLLAARWDAQRAADEADA